jgi:Tfp pilus assembly protein PilZ
MTDERRNARRARLSGVRITYESATGDRVETDAVDLARGGLFVRTANPLPVGKRISLEIDVVGKPGTWPALARIVWTRGNGADAPENDEDPPGMGLKFIDIDDGVALAIDRMVYSREPTELGVGGPTRLETPNEPSIPIELVPKREGAGDSDRASKETAGELAGPADAPIQGVPRARGGAQWLIAAGILAVAGVVTYLLLR